MVSLGMNRSVAPVSRYIKGVCVGKSYSGFGFRNPVAFGTSRPYPVKSLGLYKWQAQPFRFYAMSSNSETRPVCVVAGAGPGNGQAIAERYSKAGYAVALLSRNLEKVEKLAQEVENSRGFSCDVGSEESVKAAFGAIRSELGEVNTLVFNAGSGVFKDVENITPKEFEDSWRINALGGLLCSQEVYPDMIEKKRGNIIFIGATASRRGNKYTAAFAPAKAAQRSLAESMARQLWPKGVHVSIIILDGVVDSPQSRKMFADKPKEAFVEPNALAETAYLLSTQDPQGWTFELEVRPALEDW